MFATPSRTFFALPYWIAEHRGFFKDEGVVPSLELIGDSGKIRDRLRSGETKLAIDTADGVLLDVLIGGPLRIVGGNARRPPLFLVARSDIRTLADLRGATFGVLSLSEGSSKLIPKIMASAGLSPSDYTIVAAGGAPARATLLRERKIDAALQPMPLHYEAEAEGFNCLAWAGTHEPEWQFNTINANIEWARRESQTIVALLRALLRAQSFMLTNPDEAARIAATELRTELRFSARAVTDAIELGIFNPGFECSISALARIFQNMQDDGAIPSGEKFQLERFVDHEFLHRASRS